MSKGYVWHIYPEGQCRWVIKLQGVIHHGPNFFALCGYYYHMSGFNCRLLLRLVKPSDDLEFVELHADSDAVLRRFCHSNCLDYDMFQFMSRIPNAPLAEPNCYKPLYSDEASSGVQIPFLPVTDPVTIPDLPPLDSSYHAGLANQSLAMVGSTEITLAPGSSTSCGDDSHPEARMSGSFVMDVPELNETREDIMSFVKDFVQGLNKGVRQVVCSLCRGEKRKKLWAVKPSNLAVSATLHENKV
ncbi:hypothetical protein RSAG8_05808, partial [Rhizoctonia solani AG-8 WAC10335]